MQMSTSFAIVAFFNIAPPSKATILNPAFLYPFTALAKTSWAPNFPPIPAINLPGLAFDFAITSSKVL